MVDLFSDPGSIPGASIKRSGPAKGGAASFELSASSHQLSNGTAAAAAGDFRRSFNDGVARSADAADTRSSEADIRRTSEIEAWRSSRVWCVRYSRSCARVT